MGKWTAKWHLIKHWKATGRKPKALLEQGECPDGFEYVWTVFERLSGARTYGMAANPITYADIDAFSRVSHEPLRPWQVEAVQRLDQYWMTNR